MLHKIHESKHFLFGCMKASALGSVVITYPQLIRNSVCSRIINFTN